MERLQEQLERFAEVLAVSRTSHAGSWGRVAVRRSLRWARYLSHVHARFRRRGPVRAALEEGLRRLRPAGSFEGLGRGEQRLALGLLENAALRGPALHELLRHLLPPPGEEPRGEEEGAGQPEPRGEEPRGEEGAGQPEPRGEEEGAGQPEPRGEEEGAGLPGRLAALARRRAAAQLLLPLLGCERPALRTTEAQLLLRRLRSEEAPGPLLDRLWAQPPAPGWLDVVAEALLLPPPPAPGEDEDEDEDADADAATAAGPLLAWLLARPAPLAALGRSLPAARLAALAGRHPALAAAVLGLLSDWAGRLRFHPARAAWRGAHAQDPAWERLRDCFGALCGAPGALGARARAALRDAEARHGGFEAAGLSVWSDLLRELGLREPEPEPRAGPGGAAGAAAQPERGD